MNELDIGSLNVVLAKQVSSLEIEVGKLKKELSELKLICDYYANKYYELKEKHTLDFIEPNKD